jgi:hypothetical protein
MRNWKGLGRKRSWPNLKVLSRHSRGGTEKNHKNLSLVSWSPGRDFNPRPPECEAGVLATRTQRSVLGCWMMMEAVSSTEISIEIDQITGCDILQVQSQ